MASDAAAELIAEAGRDDVIEQAAAFALDTYGDSTALPAEDEFADEVLGALTPDDGDVDVVREGAVRAYELICALDPGELGDVVAHFDGA